ncbi:thioesterase II family protein [Streptomyces sp. NPDC048362]|uniref:thioesterase II family protein n=1 Tax=Streptomyces sp. NPDC048362 TaxID=3365539 RepID=UPI00371AEE10
MTSQLFILPAPAQPVADRSPVPPSRMDSHTTMTASAPLDSLWCRTFEPAPRADRRLVCFPHAGGSASYFRPVATALSPRVEVIAVQYPGRQDRRLEPPVDDIGLLADQIADALAPCAEPLHLFGHSMGALVAFEVALRLQRAGRTPVQLFVSGRTAPTGPARVPLDPGDAELIADVRRLNGTEAGLLEDDELLEMILPAIRNDYRAVARYRGDAAAMLSCPITAMLGDADPRAGVEETEGWKAHTSGGFDLQVFSGGHFYLSDRPAEVLDLLRRRLLGADPRLR